MDGIISVRDYPYLKQRHIAHGPHRKSLNLVHNPVIRNSNGVFTQISCPYKDEEGCARHTRGEEGCARHTTCDEDFSEYRPCTKPPDWANHPQLRNIKPENRHVFRHHKLQEWLSGVCCRQTHEPRESFDEYLVRCYAHANKELNRDGSRHLLGDALDLNHLDEWVYRLFHGVKLKLAKYGVIYGTDEEQLFLQLLREECVLLEGQLRAHLREAERQRRTSNAQEENFIRITQLARPTSLGVMLHLERRSWHA